MWRGDVAWWCGVVVWQDNGAPPDTGMNHQHGTNPGYIARNFPYRGHKGLIWEGGTRVPGFISGGSPLLPDAARGTVSHKLMHVRTRHSN
jgi:arylsulfatase A-like enzyme